MDIKEEVLAKPQYINYLLDKTATYGAIIVQMAVSTTDGTEKIIYDADLGDSPANMYPLVSNTALREILSRPEFSESGIEFYLSGDVPMNATYITVVNGDLIKLIAVAMGLVVLLYFILFRATLAGLLAPIAVVSLSVVTVLAVVGWMEWKLTIFFTMVPTLVIAVGVAQSVHLLLEYQRKMDETGDRHLAVKQALHKVGGPCLMAALTTAVGFWVMSFSQLHGLAQLGLFAPVGVLAAFVLSVTLLVVFMAGNKTYPVEKA